MPLLNILTSKAERRYVSVVWQVIVTSSSAMNQTNPFVYQHYLSILLQRTMSHLALKVCLIPFFTSLSLYFLRMTWTCSFPFFFYLFIYFFSLQNYFIYTAYTTIVNLQYTVYSLAILLHYFIGYSTGYLD